MIGLMQMIREQTLSQHRNVSDTWRPVSRWQLKVDKATWSFPISREYYRLLDACPLRLPHDQQHAGDEK